MKLCLALLSLCLLGCTYEYSQSVTKKSLSQLELGDHYSLSRQRHITIPANIKLCISPTSQSIQTDESKFLEKEVTKIFTSNVTELLILDDSSSHQSALRQAYGLRCEFMMNPQIIYQIDNISALKELDEYVDDEKEMGFDRQWLQIKLWDVNSGEIADVGLVKSRSGFFSIENKSSALLSKAISAYAHQLFVSNRVDI